MEGHTTNGSFTSFCLTRIVQIRGKGVSRIKSKKSTKIIKRISSQGKFMQDYDASKNIQRSRDRKYDLSIWDHEGRGLRCDFGIASQKGELVHVS